MSEEKDSSERPDLGKRVERLEVIIAALLERHPGLPISENQTDEVPPAEAEE
jgi:hypothetical protein